MKYHELLCQFHNDNVNANPTTTTAINFQYQEQQQLQEQQQQHSATLVVNPNDDVIKQLQPGNKLKDPSLVISPLLRYSL